MENLNLEAPVSNEQSFIATDEFQLDLVDFGTAYQTNDESSQPNLACFCGSGCLCGIGCFALDV